MAAFETTRPVPFGAETVHRVVNAFVRMGETLRDWNEARRTRDALYRLSDYQLDDIGLTRADVDRIARGGQI